MDFLIIITNFTMFNMESLLWMTNSHMTMGSVVVVESLDLGEDVLVCVGISVVVGLL